MFNSNAFSRFNQVANILKGNPEQTYQQMMSSNPKFKEFVEMNKDKSVEEVARQYGIDPSILNFFQK